MAVCLALVLAASMLAVPTALAENGNDNTGDGGTSTTPPASSDDGGSSGITGGTQSILGYNYGACNMARVKQAVRTVASGELVRASDGW